MLHFPRAKQSIHSSYLFIATYGVYQLYDLVIQTPECDFQGGKYSAPLTLLFLHFFSLEQAEYWESWC